MRAYPKTYAAAAALVCVCFIVYLSFVGVIVGVCACAHEHGLVYRRGYGHESFRTVVALEMRQEHIENSQM